MVLSFQALLARERARAEFQDWEKKEEEVDVCKILFLSRITFTDWPFSILLVADMFYVQFHFDQSKIRSEIRLREGRMKPIDILTKHLDPVDDLDIEINEPYKVFKVSIM